MTHHSPKFQWIERTWAAALFALFLIPGPASSRENIQENVRDKNGAGVAEAKEAKPIPRLLDGHPDLNGFWYQRKAGPGAKQEGASLVFQAKNPFVAQVKPLNVNDLGAPPYKPEFVAKVNDLNVHQNQLDPSFACRPPGIPRIGPPQKIVQILGEIIFLYDDTSGNFYRDIPTDGRPHDPDEDFTYLGDSVAHWEGDTLVVDTIKLNDDTWLADNGLFHSKDLHVTERLRREGDTITYQATVDDPTVFTKPWTLNPRTLSLKADARIEEADPCMDQDRSHLVNLQHHGATR